MPYEKNKARELLSIAQAHASQPNGEFVLSLADQLIGAQAEITLALGAAAQSEKELNRVTSELETAQQTIVRLRNGTAGYTEMLLALQTIAKSPKGAQKLAQQAVEAATTTKAAEAPKT